MFIIIYFICLAFVVLAGPKLLNINLYDSRNNSPVLWADLIVSVILGLIPVINVIISAVLILVSLIICWSRFSVEWMHKPIFPGKKK